MTSPTFVHLRMHSEYSIVDGIVRLDVEVKKKDAEGNSFKVHECPPVERARGDGMPALALTDLNNLFGMLKLYKAARGSGIKPIVGADVWISNESNRDQAHRLLLLCRDRKGYGNLCELLSRAFTVNQYRGRAEIEKSWLENGAADGLIALSGAQGGDVGQALLQGNLVAARKFAEEWQRLFPEAFYIELQRAGLPQTEAYIQRALDLASELQIPVVATHPIQFLDPDDFKAHEARVCISEGYVMGDQRRPRLFTEQQYFKTQAEMAELFADIPEALANSVEIAKRCNLTVQLGKNFLPDFPTPPGMTIDQFMCEEAERGLLKRLELLYPDPAQRAEQEPIYRERLKFETDTIVQMGFPGYFLIVADFINWAKNNDVPVGPGRGSGAGSLVAYSLGITDLDPLRYELLFERFLNPERVSMPDFDIDFCMDGRDRVIDYVRKKYGEDSVSQIATFGTLGSKSVIRDVGRVLDMPYNFCDLLSKLVPIEGVKPVALAKALEMEPQLKERYDGEEEVRELFDLAFKLEDLTRNVGMHAGGVLISPGKISDFCPVYCQQGSDATVSQFDKDDVEQAGLVKFDFLGLRTLTIIDWAVRFIKQMGHEFGPLELLPLDDPGTYRLLKDCNTTSVFQLESRGMKELIRRLQPDCFDDIVALVALFRPGPLGSGMVDDFINRKHGKARAEYFHPSLEITLKPTYGVIVYQEQVMQVAQILGGYSLGSADMLRRAMGKKKADEMAKHRAIFVEGALKLGVAEKLASELFGLMEKFAEYGFNKSHSAAYALVAYQTAYLKAHFASAFMAATLSADMFDTDKVHTIYDDCVANKLEVLPPDVNESEYRFVPLDAKRIRYGLGAIKGTGEGAIAAIVEARRQGGPFSDLYEFCRRVDKRAVNRRVVESLIRAGAFDTLCDHRNSLLSSVGVALELAEQAARNANQNSLFDDPGDHGNSSNAELLDAPLWSPVEQLLQEKKALGFYFSGHPYDGYRSQLAGFIKTRLDKLTPQQNPVWLAGVVYAIRTQMTKRGKMAIIALDDGTEQVEVSVFSEAFDANRDLLKEDQLLVIEGKVSKDEYRGGLRVVGERLFDLTAARTHFAKCLKLSCNGTANTAKLQDILSPHKQGGCPVKVCYRNQVATCDIDLGAGWKVDLHEQLLESLGESLGKEHVVVQYQ
ncbi:MAG: DNA polymerase III subunit alpha [Sulfuricella sp.]|nr:DNA polymerase III subunit alpha [Sulfuricella sp.]